MLNNKYRRNINSKLERVKSLSLEMNFLRKSLSCSNLVKNKSRLSASLRIKRKNKNKKLCLITSKSHSVPRSFNFSRNQLNRLLIENNIDNFRTKSW